MGGVRWGRGEGVLLVGRPTMAARGGAGLEGLLVGRPTTGGGDGAGYEGLQNPTLPPTQVLFLL